MYDSLKPKKTPSRPSKTMESITVTKTKDVKVPMSKIVKQKVGRKKKEEVALSKPGSQKAAAKGTKPHQKKEAVKVTTTSSAPPQGSRDCSLVCVFFISYFLCKNTSLKQ